jgi:dipeptide/tripeptide permease
MYKFLQKYGIPASFGLASFFILISVLLINSRSISYKVAFDQSIEHPDVKKLSSEEEKNEKVRELALEIVKQSEEHAVSPLLTLSLVFFIGCAVVSLALPVYLMRDDKKKIIQAVSLVVGAVVLWFVFYSFSSTDVANSSDLTFTDKDAKTTGAVIGLIVLGTIGAIGALIWGEINKIINER